MDYEVSQRQAKRLKSILFPGRKHQRSEDKENSESNSNINLRNQINHLKYGMQIFMEKQACRMIDMPEHSFSTPRQCLEIIRKMSFKVTNFDEDLEEAVATLLDSLPKFNRRQHPTHPHIVNSLKINCLFSAVSVPNRRTLSNAFELLKTQFVSSKMIEEREFRQLRKVERKFQAVATVVKSQVLWNWKLAIVESHKQSMQAQIQERGINKLQGILKHLSQESKLVMWLQEWIQSSADSTQILILDPKNDTVKGYVYASDSLASIFETIESQSQLGSETHSAEKIKQIRFTLEHSLTKICITKRQPLKIESMCTDSDYRSIDNIISMHGLSSREIPSSCIFTPLISPQGQPIGILRQYFHHRYRSLDHQLVSKVSELLSFGIQSSRIFEQVKEKALAIRQQYYIKAMSIFNSLDSPYKSTENVHENFLIEIRRVFDLQAIDEYRFTTEGHPTACFILEQSALKQDQKYIVSQLITALNKMVNYQTDYIFDNQTLLIRSSNSLYRIRFGNNCRSHALLIAVLADIFAKKAEILELKQRQREQAKQKQIQMKLQQEKQKVINKRNSINQFCLLNHQINSKSEFIQVAERYVSEFLPPNSKIELQLISAASQCEKEQVSYNILDNGSWLIRVVSPNQGEQVPEPVLQPLKKLAAQFLNRIYSPVEIDCHFHLSSFFYRQHSTEQPVQQLIISCLLKYLKIQSTSNLVSICQLPQNPYQAQFYSCYLPAQFLDTRLEPFSSQTTKLVRKFGYELNGPIEERPSITLVCLNNGTLFIIREFYCIPGQFLEELNALYCGVLEREKRGWQRKAYDRLMLTSANFHQIFERIRMTSIRNSLNRMKIASKKQLIDFCRLNRWIHKTQFQLVSLCFSRIVHTHRKSQDLMRSSRLVNIVQRTCLKSQGAGFLFRALELKSKISQSIRKAVQIIINCANQSLHCAWFEIVSEATNTVVNRFLEIESLFSRRQRECLTVLKRTYWSRRGCDAIHESQCSIIPKLNSINKLILSMSEKYSNYHTLFSLSTGTSQNLYLLIDFTNKQYTLTEILPIHNNIEYQFPTHRNRVGLTKLIWVTPEAVPLTEKHYLQVLSKALEQFYTNYIEHYKRMIEVLENIFDYKYHQDLKQSFRLIVQHNNRSIKSEEYRTRESIYEDTLELENLKLLEIEFAKEQQLRQLEALQTAQSIEFHHHNISTIRQGIVRMNISSRKIEEQQIKHHVEAMNKELQRLFTLWRHNAGKCTLILRVKKLNHLRSTCAINSIARLLNRKQTNLKRNALTMMKLVSAHLKAIDNRQKLQEGLDLGNNENTNPIERLLTFQDDFNPQDHVLSSLDNCHNSQVSIIPISLKQIEPTERENYQPTEAEVKRINSGVYKLNPKTLKFLKRMGKINSK